MLVRSAGPSDTTTKCIDSIEEHVSIRTPRTIATARHLKAKAIAWHRCLQQATAKKDLDKYPTLFAYRHAASERCSVTKSLGLLITMMEEELKTVPVPASPTRSIATLVPPNTAPRRPTRNAVTVDRVGWGFQSKEGYTPGRGRSANEFHRLRELRCDGRVLVYVVPEPSLKKKDDSARGCCSVCGVKTNFYCTGCKNFLCFGATQAMTESRIAKIQKKRDESKDDNVVDADEDLPSTLMKMPIFDPKTEAWTALWSKNNCYSVKHKHIFDQAWDTKQLDFDNTL